MKLEEIRQAYEGGSGSANTINRQLVFSGIAVIWILKGGQDSQIAGIPGLLLWALGLLAASLLVDLLQSLVHTGLWYRKYCQFKNEELAKRLKNKENEGLDESTIIVEEKESWSIPTWIIWGLKIALTMAAYVLIIVHLVMQLQEAC